MTGGMTVEQAAELAERIPCGCDWSPEIEGCPHREWCDRMTPLGTIRTIADLAAPLLAAAERDRLKAGPVSDCCGTTWSRVPAGGWSCAGCGQECGLLGLLPARQVRAEPAP